MANRYAKKKKRDVGVYFAGNAELINEMLTFTEVGDICKGPWVNEYDFTKEYADRKIGEGAEQKVF